MALFDAFKKLFALFRIVKDAVVTFVYLHASLEPDVHKTLCEIFLLSN